MEIPWPSSFLQLKKQDFSSTEKDIAE